MNLYCKKIYFAIVLIFGITMVFNTTVLAQKKNTVHPDSLLLGTYFNKVSEFLAIKIYYKDSWVDTLLVHKNTSAELFAQQINGILDNSKINYIFIGNDIVLTGNYRISTGFAQDYKFYVSATDAQTNSDSVIYASPLKNDRESHISNDYKVFKIGKPTNTAGRAVFKGQVINAETGQALPGVTVFVEKIKRGAVTDVNGNYTLDLPTGQHRVEYRLVGMHPAQRNIILNADGEINVSLFEKGVEIEQVNITGEKNGNVQSTNMGVEQISVRMLKQIPMAMGEADVIKSSLLLPGVQSVSEASSGFNVRGGSTSQNLILLNGAPIINPSHFFGFFSAFNSDLIENVNLYKNGIPAKYGGRISSVMDIEMKKGNYKKWNLNGGINLLSGRFMAEGPIIKNKLSIGVSARTTYSDWLLGYIPDIKLKKSDAGFYDTQFLINYDINKKNNLQGSFYASSDNFNYYQTSAYNYSNTAGTLKWKHNYSPLFYMETSVIYSGYKNSIFSLSDTLTASVTDYKISQIIERIDFSYFINEKNRLEYGVEAIQFQLSPGNRQPYGIQSQIEAKALDNETASENAIYISNKMEISPNLSIMAGLRYSFFALLGPKTVNNYTPGMPISEDNINGTTAYDKYKPVVFYHAPEIRITGRYIFKGNSSLKFGYQRVNQYLHMISNTTAEAPTDTWKLSDTYIKPEKGDQFSLGWYVNNAKNTVEFSTEVYYKALKNIIDYKNGSQLQMNQHIETELLKGIGRAYGVELMLAKNKGKLTGWISYSYSRIEHKVITPFTEELVNNGNYFPANYDKPHDVKIIANIKLSRRLNVSTNFMYNTGRPITYPVAFFTYENVNRVYYSGRNEYRIPDYVRFDIAATLNGNLRAKKLLHSSVTFAVYNLFGRKNPYSIYFKNEGGLLKGYKMSIFGKPIFTVTYNFKIFGNASDDY